MTFAYRDKGNERGARHALDFLEKVSPPVTLPTNPQNLESLALTRALVGDRDGALKYLRQAVELGWANYYGVVKDPASAETPEFTEFQALLDKAKADNDEQRAIVETGDAGHDFRAEFEQMMSARPVPKP